jgi:hypothetical protein
MSTDRPDAGESGDLIISGSVGALRDLAGPEQLTELQLKIIHWYQQLQQPLSGPRSGNERGPAQQPPWVKQGPRVQTVELVTGDRDGYAYLLEGSGLGAATDVLLDGAPVRGWDPISSGRLVIPIPPAIADGAGAEVEIEVRTPLGDLVVRADSPATLDLN